MHRKIVLAFGLALALAAPCSAAMIVIGGNHVFTNPGESTFPIFSTSDSGDEIVAVELFLVMAPDGPLITKVDLIQGTVFQNNHVGQGDFAAPEYLTPGRTPAYFTATSWGHVPEGIVAWVTVDFTGIEPGVYDLFLSNEDLGPSSVYYGLFGRGFFTNGTVTLVPEPSSILLGIVAAASLGAIALRRRRRS